jgi:hypothetical protein
VEEQCRGGRCRRDPERQGGATGPLSLSPYGFRRARDARHRRDLASAGRRDRRGCRDGRCQTGGDAAAHGIPGGAIVAVVTLAAQRTTRTNWSGTMVNRLCAVPLIAAVLMGVTGLTANPSGACAQGAMPDNRAFILTPAPRRSTDQRTTALWGASRPPVSV